MENRQNVRWRFLMATDIKKAILWPPFSSMNLRSSTTYMRILNNGIYTNSK